MPQTNHQTVFPEVAQSFQNFASISAQMEMFEKLVEINRHWLDHVVEESRD